MSLFALRRLLGQPAWSIPHPTPGITPFRSWAMIADIDPLLAARGTVGDYGYDQRAIALWMAPSLYRTIGPKESIILGVAARKPPRAADTYAGRITGIQEVWFSVDEGPWTRVTEELIHPEYGYSGFLIELREQDFATSGPKEVRYIAVPRAGKPFCGQGRDASGPANASALADLTDKLAGPQGWSIDPRTMPTFPIADGLSNQVNFVSMTPDSWSFIVNVNKGLTGNKMPSAIRWIDDINATGNASDANDGLTRETPWLTWDKVHEAGSAAIHGQMSADEITWLNGSKEVGGLTVYITGVGDNHYLPSSTTLRPLYGCRHQNVRYIVDPLLPAGSVKFSRSLTYPICVEKRLVVGAHFDNVTWPYASANSPWVAHGAAFYEDCKTNSVSGGFQPSGIYVGQPLGLPGWSFRTQQYSGHGGLINCKAEYVVDAGIFCSTTLLHNYWVDHLNSVNDVHGCPKLSYRFKLSNCVDMHASGGGHTDFIQPYRGGTMIMVIEPDCLGAQVQGIYWDGNSPMKDMAIVEPKLYSPGTPVLGMASINTNLGVWMTTAIAGGTQVLWNEADPLAPSVCVRFICSAPGKAGVWETTFRRGLSTVYTGVTKVEPPDAVLATEWDVGNPIAVWDADLERTMILYTSGSGDAVLGNGTPRVFRWCDAKQPDRIWEMSDAGGNNTDRRRPVRDATLANGKAAIKFIAANANVTPQVDSNMYGINGGANLQTYPLQAINGTAEREIWYVFNFQEPDTGLPQTRGARTMFEPIKNLMRVQYSITSGLRQFLILSQSTAGAATQSLAAYTIQNGWQIMRIKLYSDRIGCVIYNAANPSGITFADTVFAGGATKSLGVSNSTISGAATTPTGANLTFVQHWLSAFVVYPRLDGDPVAEAAVLAVARARCGF